MSINALTEAIKAIAQSLQVATIFPSLLFMLVHIYIIVPRLQGFFKIQVDTTAPPTLAIVAALSLIMSYALYAFNFPLIQLLEGYHPSSRRVWKAWLDAKRSKFRNLTATIKTLKTRIRRIETEYYPHSAHTDPTWQILSTELFRAESEFEYTFPSGESLLQPTTLGNIIAAYEDYSRTRYGMESSALWPRLVPILKERQYLDFVTQEKVVFDFLLNTGLVTVFLGLELGYLTLFLNQPLLGGGLILLTLVAGWVFYFGLTVAADQWGMTVRVAFDLYRDELRKRLGLRVADTFAAEHVRWQETSRFLHGRPGEYDKYQIFELERERMQDKSNPSPTSRVPPTA